MVWFSGCGNISETRIKFSENYRIINFLFWDFAFPGCPGWNVPNQGRTIGKEA
jgi:hypothetical protein